MGTVAYACDLNTEKVEAERTKDQGHPWLYSRLEASLGYIEILFQSQPTNQPTPNKPTNPQTNQKVQKVFCLSFAMSACL